MLEFVTSLGLGEQLTAALVFALIAMYIIRGKKFLSSIIGVMGTLGTVALGVLLVGVVAFARGYVDPEPAVFLRDVGAFIQTIVEFGWQSFIDTVVEGLP